MTFATSAGFLAAPEAGLPPAWWARATALRERLAAPQPPQPLAGDAATRRVDGPEGERLARLGLGPEAWAALAGEPAERLAARTGKPGWAVFVEEAIASAPVAPEFAPPVAADSAAVFAPVFRPFVDAAVRRLAAQAGGAEPAELTLLAERFGDWLGGRLVGLAARTLVAELGAARAADRLTGGRPADRFADFLARVGSRAGLAALCADYPVLARLLGQTCLRTGLAAAELLVRLAGDRAAIVAKLLGGTDPGPLTRVELGRGDPHQQGRSVALLRFANGSTVVYKPRTLAQHVFLDRMAAWLDTKVPGLGLRTPRTVPGEDYGWVEYVEYATCRSLTEVDLFYRRHGALLALAYTVEGVDLHCENLVAHRDQPVLVDVETLLHPTLCEATNIGPDPAAAAHSASVHRTCLLPQLMVGELGAVDISALGGAPGGDFPNARMAWEDAGTDTMRLVRRPAPFAGARNRPRGSTGGGPADHLEALLTGFRVGYEAIVAHRDELLAPNGPLAGAADAVGRLVARPTMLYATLLEESTHPDLLRDGLGRDAVLSVLWTESADDPARRRLVEHEIADLWDGDVPLFQHRPTETVLRASDGTRVGDVLETSGLDSALSKIAAMGALDRHDQEWIISASLAATRPDAATPHHRSASPAHPSPAAVPDPSKLLAAACGLADEIAARAARADGRANWLGLEPVDAHWTVLPMGAGLAQGYCGVALFLAQLGALTGSALYTDLARQAVAPVPGLVAALAADPELSRAVGPGGFEGLGGIGYAVARLATLVDDGIADCLPTVLDALAVAALDDPDARADVSAGLAGALAALHTIHRERALPAAAALADRVADRLLAAARPDRSGRCPSAEPGFMLGSAGVGWALLRHARLTGDGARQHGDAGRELLGAAFDAAPAENLGWCSGLSGVLLAAADGIGPDRFGPDGFGPGGIGRFDAPVRQLIAHPPLADLSLCHGELGLAEALAVLADRGHQGARTGLASRVGLVLGTLRQQGHRCGTPGHVPTPGLLNGLSGIGYALLRLGFAESVPSVHLLDPTPPDGPSGLRPQRA
ncbi:type 2 lanthipeptide synthetase LanM [Streptomyces sp. NPDC092296]|uniref:type 2 lanthipeptide synthetase LanM family protein n=1 Tax=Streptomyces sp. NPDC092296 TaxID=3366012 RepID=UPI00382F7AFD